MKNILEDIGAGVVCLVGALLFFIVLWGGIGLLILAGVVAFISSVIKDLRETR